MLFKSILNISLSGIIKTLALSAFLFSSITTSLEIKRENKTETPVIAQLAKAELETIAQAITVKVHVGEYHGSGILMKRDNNTYTVITNAHVAERGDTYSIETSDGIKHTATLLNKDDSNRGNDLALLQFNSSNNYQIAKVGDSTNLTEGEEVLAAGFPFDADKLNITTGKISLLPDKSLQGGYQIGFTNETVQGMSGGILLNSVGEVIGVLGKGKGAIFDTAYTYIDGTIPTPEALANFKDASFSIPIANIADLSPNLASILPQPPQQKPEILSQAKQYTGIVGKVDNIAQQITVRIDNLTDNSNGSGVIIAKQGNSYYVATAKHVLCVNVATSECEAKGQHHIVTPDGVTHKLDYQTVRASGKWLDVAVFKFESSNNYSVATLGKYDVGGKWVFVSGFPGVKSGSNTQPSRMLTGGQTIKKDFKNFLAKDTYSLKSNGEGLVYTNLSYRGMSGGAVLDTEGRLVGINTGAENEVLIDEKGNYEQLSLGFSLAVAIQDFLGLVEKRKMAIKPQWLQISTTPPSEISNADTSSIREQLLTTTKPNADAGIAAWMNYGNQLWRYEKYTEAIDAFERVIKLDPNFDKAYYAIGLAFWYQRKYEQAVTAFTKATKINPNLYYYWRYLGSSHTELKKYTEAKTAYKTAISKNPQDFVLYVELGTVLGNSKDYQSAIESYNQALNLNSDHPWAYNHRGVGYAELKQYPDALADFNQAIKINPQLSQVYNNRGNIYNELKQYPDALADFNQAIKINPQFAHPYNGRGVTYAILGNVQQGRKDLQQAATLYLKQNNRQGYQRVQQGLKILSQLEVQQ